MARPSASRLTAMSGVAFVALGLFAFIAFTHSGYPDSGDRAAKVAAYFTEHRGATLAQAFFFSLCTLAGLCFVAGVVSMMWQTEAIRPLAVVGALTGAAATAVTMMGCVFVAALAYRTPVGDPGLSRSLLDLSYITLNASGYLLAAFIAVASVAALRHHVMASYVGFVGLPVAALQVVGGAAYASGDGGLSPQGWLPIVAALSVLVWTLCVVAAVLRPSEATHPAPTAAAPA